jgi:hypothetical protein
LTVDIYYKSRIFIIFGIVEFENIYISNSELNLVDIFSDSIPQGNSNLMIYSNFKFRHIYINDITVSGEIRYFSLGNN